MATKIERAFAVAAKKAKDYVEGLRRYLSSQYCMSSDQISRVEEAYRKGFTDGAAFK